MSARPDPGPDTGADPDSDPRAEEILSAPASVGLLLRRAHRRAARAFAERLRPHGIDNRHAGVLLQLARTGPVTQRDLITLLGSDKSSMVRTIDELELRGLAVRGPHPTDRRAHAVEATAAGRVLIAKIQAGADTASRQLLACLTPEQGALLLSLLQQFADAEDPAPDQP